NEVIQIGRAEHVHATWTQDPTNLREMSDRILDVFEYIVRHAGIERGVGEGIGPRVEHAHLFQGVVGPHSWIDIHTGQTSEGGQIAGGRVRGTGRDAALRVSFDPTSGSISQADRRPREER